MTEEVIWEDTETLLGSDLFSVFIGQKPSGTFLIVSNSTPRFCFEAETRDLALEKGKEALSFYQQTRKMK